ncbi:MAG: exosortase/archaeosortase family protein [Phycisphaerales bacterium]|nr:exosortase/archaeosortase family protein [Phycisphaerales bacterium]
MAATASGAGGGSAKVDSAVVLRAWLAPANLAMAGLLLVGIAAMFGDWFLRQHQFSSRYAADWGHAYMVPLISAYVVWTRRDEIARLKPSVFWPGMLPLLLGLAVYILFTLMDAPGIHMFQGFAITLCVAGLAMLLLGPAIFGVVAFPIMYLAFGVTLADKLMGMITFQLQILATKGDWLTLNMFGLSTDIMGNALTMRHNGRVVPLNVAEACAGMRMVIAFLALGVAVAFLSCPRWWQRVALVLMAVPVALATNVLRVVTLAVMSLVNPGFAAGDAHTLIGVLWLVPAFLAYMGIVWLLKRIVREPATKGAKA